MSIYTIVIDGVWSEERKAAEYEAYWQRHPEHRHGRAIQITVVDPDREGMERMNGRH